MAEHVDLFAAGPQARTDAAAPSPEQEPARLLSSAGAPGARAAADGGIADRAHDHASRTGGANGRAPAGRPASAAEATSTMPGLLFVPGTDPAAANPTPAVSPPTLDTEPPDANRSGARIRGYRCENGHLNDPRSPSCRQCGATIDERAGGLVAGRRPPLGRLVFDDGAAHVVDGGYLVGRMPEVDERVRTGELRPIVVEDRAGSVSRVHAEVRVSGWDVIVVDTGSRNGTYVCGPNEGSWSALQPRRSRRLLPGTRVRLGARMFVFESSSTVR